MKKLTTILFLLMIPFILAGCDGTARKEVEQVVSADLDKLKNLDTGTVEQYISTENLFPDVSESDADAGLVEEFVALYFENFDYKILDTNVSQDHAEVSLRLNTLDAQTLARDFFTTHLTESIFAAANNPQENPVQETSLTDHLNLLDRLIQENNYRTVENNCTLSLNKKDNTWVIRKSDDLENEIVGGFISRITDPNLLTPDETLDIYLSTLKQLDDDQLANYLGISSLLMDGDATRASLASALMKQAKTYYGYKIGRVDQNGYTATVDVQIQTFDYDSILSAYNDKSKEYLSTPQAIYDGQEGRLAKSHELLLECVKDNSQSTTLDVPVKMVNDGFSWTPTNTKNIGSAIFGSVADTLDEEQNGGESESGGKGENSDQEESGAGSSDEDDQGENDSDEDSDSDSDSDYNSDSDYDSDSGYDSDSSYDSDSGY